MVKKDKLISPICSSYKGERQGGELGALLFNLYTNDMPSIFHFPVTEPVSLNTTRLSCLLYAHDSIISSESEKGLQSSQFKLLL